MVRFLIAFVFLGACFFSYITPTPVYTTFTFKTAAAAQEAQAHLRSALSSLAPPLPSLFSYIRTLLTCTGQELKAPDNTNPASPFT